LELSFIVAANAVFLGGNLSQKPKGVFELFSGLKPPARHPTALTCHESVGTDGPSHDALCQKVG
jgi:hypothetical protein